jgi:putative nucleotidyltransferase with HDIG domain
MIVSASQRDDNPYLRRIQSDIRRMPSLSTTVNKVLKTCSQIDPSPHDLNRIIELDPVLTGQVLKLVNSAYFALYHQVHSVTHAIILLGINTIKNLALSVAVLGTFRDRRSFRAFSTRHFWEHSLAVAVVAKFLARLRNSSRSEQEEYFIAGLLHDIGKIPLNRHFPTEYGAVIRRRREEKVGFDTVEAETFGFDHATVGQMIAARWRLNAQLEGAIARHHQPAKGGGGERPCTGFVALADAVVNDWGLGLIPAADSPLEPGPETLRLMRFLAVDPSSVEGLKAHLQAEIRKAQAFLEVTRGR